MSQESLQETIEKQVLEAAIKAVKDRGWDVNPFTVAEEARVVPHCITRSNEFMQLIISERGGDMSFLPRDEELLKRNSELESTVQDLEKENNSLATRLSEVEQNQTKSPEEELLAEQMKALLTSESDAQVKQLEQELEQAYTQVLDLEEEQRDLQRSVTGLEKVNEALNVRLRELEAERDALVQNKGAGSAAPSVEGMVSQEEFEALKVQLTARAEELAVANRNYASAAAELEARNQQLQAMIGQHEGTILDLEAKLHELQQEADMLALQLQNAFNVGYQKAVADNQAAQAPAQGSDIAAVQQFNASPQPAENYQPDQSYQPPENNQPAADQQTVEGYQPAVENYQPVAESQPTVESCQPVENYKPAENFQPQQQSMAQPEAAKPAKEYAAHAYDESEAGWGNEDRIHNFARTGPYVASQYNPLESLTWRDLETVYSMGVLSIKDFSRNLGDYNPTSTEVGRDAEETVELAAESNTSNGESTAAAETETRRPAPPPPPPRASQPVQTPDANALNLPKGELDFINPDDVLDLDKLDIFENLEELEDLTNLEAMYQPLNISFEDNFEDSGKETGDRIPAINNRVGVETGDQAPLNQEESLGTGFSPEELRQLMKERDKREKERPAETDIKRKFAGSNKFVGKGGDKPAGEKSADDNDKVAPETKSSTAIPAIPSKAISPEVRKACGLLGLRPDEVTKEAVMREWKKQFAANHPDLGGDKETAIALNDAKQTLLRFLEQNAPKLGSKFGKKKQD